MKTKTKKKQKIKKQQEKKSLQEIYKGMKRIDKILIIVLSILTLFRVYLAVKMPIIIQAGAMYDDYLLVDYARNILNFNWLGNYGPVTLAKGISYSLYLVIMFILGIPYSFSLIMLYIFAIVLFITAIKKFINNRYYLMAIYLSLLYSPGMLHIENVQKVYRGGVILIFALIVISAMIHLYNNRNNNKKFLLWSIFASLSLSFFYYLKEDSMWILPFVIASIGITIYQLFKNKDKYIKTKIFISVLPIIMLVLVNSLYSYVNYLNYGLYTITDRTGTYYKEVLEDLITINEDNEIQDVWITKDMMYKALDNSKTLNEYREYIDKMYEDSWALNSNGQVEGDIIYWTLREAFDEAGLYNEGARHADDVFKAIDNELDAAYAKGDLVVDTDNKIYLSSISAGFTKDELINYYKENIPKAINMYITYNENNLYVDGSSGEYQDMMFMDMLTNSNTIWPEHLGGIKQPYEIIVKVCMFIVSIYQKLGYLVFTLGFLGYILFVIKQIKDLKNKIYEELELSLILLGMVGISVILVVGVLWFCSPFNGTIMAHLYNYTSGMIPLFEILKVTGIYFLIREVTLIINKKGKKKYAK